MTPLPLWSDNAMRASVSGAALAALAALGLTSCNQLGSAAGSIPENVPSVESALGPAPAISTSFADVQPGVALPDGADPKAFESLLILSRGTNGEFILQPGAYELKLRSYCLHAGTHGPSRGDGYLYAPLKGSRAQVIQSVLRNSEQHPEITQRDVQSLIWAIEVFTPIKDLSPELRHAGTALLSKKQVEDLNGGLLGEIPPELTQEAVSKLPPQAREIYEAQDALRRRLSSGTATFEQLEAIAVLAGAPSAGPSVPRGEWSRHPGGFYVRYLPTNYATTLLQVYVPASAPTHGQTNAKPMHVAGIAHLASETDVAAARAPPQYDPTADVATPANTGSQRLGISAVPFDSTHCKDVSPQGTPINPLGTGRKINIYGEGETPGFDDYATEAKYATYAKNGQQITRPLTSAPVPPGVADHTASDISMRSAPVSSTTASEIGRIAKPGARLTYAAAAAGFDAQAKKLLDAFPNAKLLESCTWDNGIGKAMVLQLP